ncbi:MAG: putative bifunctional diguanylate cyclase/phosphodiesterase [Myxococcota bacterium]
MNERKGGVPNVTAVADNQISTADLLDRFEVSILVVEDDRADLRWMSTVLGAQPGTFTIQATQTLREALQTLEAGDYGLVLLDLSLPDADGIDAVREIHHRHPHIPVVALTSFADQRMALRAVKAGAQDFLVKGRTDGAALIHAIRYAIERKRSESRLAFLALHDELTGLANRTQLRERLERALDRCRRSGNRCAVLFLDLDHFKDINDTLGHDTGDMLLKQVADRLRTCVRSFETVARQGGDEFVILLEHIDSVEDAVAVARRVLNALEQPFDIPQLNRPVRTSIGIATSESTDDVASIVEKADQAMYRAKQAGRGTFSVFVPDSVQGELSRIIEDVPGQLRRLGFAQVFEPWMALEAQTVVAVEAMLRWQHPVHGQLSGAELWPFLDQAGVAEAVMDWSLLRAARLASQWDDVRLVVSVRDLVVEERFAERVMEVLRQSGLPVGRLELSIREDALIAKRERTVARMERLRALGLRIGIDDFGSRCGLEDLARLPVDTVRLHQNLTSELEGLRRRRALLMAVVKLSRDLGIETFVSGVETMEEEKMLAEMGCTGLSGDVVSPALPSGAFAAWLSQVSGSTT